MVVEKNITNTDGTVLTVTQKGVDGVAVQSTDETAAQVLDALNAGRGAELTATVKVTDHKTESRKVDYTSPNGDPHMVINLSEQKVYAYKGSTLVKTFMRLHRQAIHADRQRHVLRAHQVPVADHARRRLRHAERAMGHILQPGRRLPRRTVEHRGHRQRHSEVARMHQHARRGCQVGV